MNLENKIIILTGAGRGLGKSLALMLAAKKPKLALLARTQAELETVAAESRSLGAEALVIPTDLCKPEQIESAVKETVKTFGSVDVLINNAGFSPALRPVTETLLEDWDYALALNARAPFLLSKACLPTMLAKKSGHIINILTAVVDVPVATISAYRASKVALRAVAECMREEVKPFVKVSNILPEPMDTPMRWEATPDYPKDRVMMPEDVARVVQHVLEQDEKIYHGDIPVRLM